MKQNDFENKWHSFWDEYNNNLSNLEHQKDIFVWDDFPSDYRRICQHLSLARTRCYSLALIEKLQKMVFNGHKLLYSNQKTPWLNVMKFFFIDFPITVREHKVAFYASLIVFLLPAVVVGILSYFDNTFIYNIMPATEVLNMEQMYSDGIETFGKSRESDTDWYMFGYYIQNNISISFQVFAGGLLAGLGTLFYLFYNGILLGSVGGHLTQLGAAENFWSFVCGHGAFELTAIVISGQAGLILASVLINPGNATRRERLVQQGRKAAIIVAGTTIMLIIAAFLEAFWSSSTHIEPQVKYIVAAVLWIAVISFFIFSGRGYIANNDLEHVEMHHRLGAVNED